LVIFAHFRLFELVKHKMSLEGGNHLLALLKIVDSDERGGDGDSVIELDVTDHSGDWQRDAVVNADEQPSTSSKAAAAAGGVVPMTLADLKHNLGCFLAHKGGGLSLSMKVE
jgi:hypothetical protein